MYRWIAAAILFVLLPLPADAQTDPGPAPGVHDDRAAWAADLEAFFTSVRARHPEPFRVHPQAEWLAHMAQVKRRLPEMEWAHFVVEMHRLAALARDGHTNVLPFTVSGPGFDRWLPVRFRLFDDGLYVIAAAPEAEALLGGRIETIAGKEWTIVGADLAALIGHDSPMWALNWMPVMLRIPGYTYGLGYSKSASTLTLEVEHQDGRRVSLDVAAVPREPEPHMLTVHDRAGVEARPPRWMSEEAPFSFEHLPEHKAVYVLFQEVRDAEDETLGQFAGRLFDFVRLNGIRRLIIDVRNNGGGNNTLLQPLVHGVIRSDLDRPGGVYVLIGRQTFSAASNFVTFMERDTQVLFAGEPTGESPNQFGDPEPVALPNTGILTLVSTLRWQPSFPSDPRRWTLPDIPVRTTFADYLAGRDPVLDAVLAHDASGIEPAEPPVMRWRRDSQRGEWTLPFPVD